MEERNRQTETMRQTKADRQTDRHTGKHRKARKLSKESVLFSTQHDCTGLEAK